MCANGWATIPRPWSGSPGRWPTSFPAGYKEGGVFRPGYDERVDELTHLLTHGREMLAELESRERRRTGIGTLKVGYNRVFGYYIEVSRANLDRVPEDYIRKQTLANAERYVTQELKEFESRVLRAQEERNAREEELFLALRESLKDHLPSIQAAAEAVADLDVLLSFSELAADGGYGRPRVNGGKDIVIENGRHPVVEKMLGRHAFVPNDCRLSPDEARLAIITGPNMAGKSTYIRQVALIVLLAHAGSYVPADRAEIGVVDRIFTRIGASDDLSRGESTFMVEMRETARILSGITERTLVVLDEVGRGTSTYDGLSIAWAVAEHLHDAPARPKVLFATHFHELTDIVSTSAYARNYHVAVREWQGDIIFLRRIDEGVASKSYGIQVARLAGLPQTLIERARDILKNLESAEYNEFGLPSLSGAQGGSRACRPDGPVFPRGTAGRGLRPGRAPAHRAGPAHAGGRLDADRGLEREVEEGDVLILPFRYICGALLAVLLSAAPVSPPAAHGAAPPGSPPVLSGIHAWTNEIYTRVAIYTGEEVHWQADTVLADPSRGLPPRIFVDIRGVGIKSDILHNPVGVNNGLLRQVRAGRYSRDTVRVVIDLERSSTFRVFALPDPYRIIIDIDGEGADPAASGRRGGRRRPRSPFPRRRRRRRTPDPGPVPVRAAGPGPRLPRRPSARSRPRRWSPCAAAGSA